MAITRVKTGGWKYGDNLTSSQLNDLDTNVTYGLDKRVGETDTLSSDVTVDGSLTFNAGSSLILDPSTVTIGDGVLSTGAELIGDDSVSDPLRFGYNEVTISSPTVTLTATEYNTFNIKFVGVLTADTQITFPATAGYAKIIDNATTGDYELSVIASGSSNKIVINQGKQKLVFCDGTNLIVGSDSSTYSLISYFNKKQSSVFGTFVATINSTSYILIDSGYSTSFTDVQLGDIFKIEYRVRSTATLGDGARIGVYVSGSGGDDILTESIFEHSESDFFPVAGMVAEWTATSTSNLTIELRAKSLSGGDVDIYSPVNFSIEHIRP